jgi:hypothetical protein
MKQSYKSLKIWHATGVAEYTTIVAGSQKRRLFFGLRVVSE